MTSKVKVTKVLNALSTGESATKLAKRYKVSPATIYAWKKKRKVKRKVKTQVTPLPQIAGGIGFTEMRLTPGYNSFDVQEYNRLREEVPRLLSTIGKLYMEMSSRT